MENEMTNQESLDIINKMIRTAKEQIDSTSAFYYLLWGYLVVAASLLQYTMVKFMHIYEKSSLAWLLMLVGLIITIPYSIQQSKKIKVKTYTGGVIGYLWMAYGISIGVICFGLFYQNKPYLFTPIILTLVAFGIFVTGIAYRFRPLIIGAIICWASACIAFTVFNIEQLLINALGIAFGYIIPGHMIYMKKNV
jgi:hypothetical protein